MRIYSSHEICKRNSWMKIVGSTALRSEWISSGNMAEDMSCVINPERRNRPWSVDPDREERKGYLLFRDECCVPKYAVKTLHFQARPRKWYSLRSFDETCLFSNTIILPFIWTVSDNNYNNGPGNSPSPLISNMAKASFRSASCSSSISAMEAFFFDAMVEYSFLFVNR